MNINAGASTGSYIGVDAEGAVNMRGVSATGGAGVTVGDHFEVGGGAQATYEKGKIQVGVSGDVAALVGIEVDASVSIDTNQIQKDVINTEKVIEHVVNDIAKDVHKTENKIENTAKKAGKDIKKGFKKVF